MGIRHVGDSTAKLLAKQFKGWDALLEAPVWRFMPAAVNRMSPKKRREKFGFEEEVSPAEETGLGEGTAQVVWDYLHSPVAQRTFAQLNEVGVDLSSHDYVEPGKASVVRDGPFAGKTVVLTGTDHYEREDLKGILGWGQGERVGPKTHLSSGPRGQQADKAQELAWYG
jgi:NAD-dependent DNA ligase